MPRFLSLAVASLLPLLSVASFAQTATSTTLTAAPASGPFGTAISLSSTVASTTPPTPNNKGAVLLPTGTVQFYDGATALSPTPVPLTRSSLFNTTPFASAIGPIDPALVGVSGELTGDLNGDGNQDLLLFGNSFSVFPQQSDIEVQSFVFKSGGGYTALPAQSLAFPYITSSRVVLADINADGKLDLLSDTFVAYGNGDGTFQQPVALPFLSTGYAQIYTADVNGDGRVDIIAMNTIPSLSDFPYTPYDLQVTVFLNQGQGAFQSVGTFPLSSGENQAYDSLASLHFVDLNGDGQLDMVAEMYYVPPTNAEEPPTLTSLLNNGDGTFGAPIPIHYTRQGGGLLILLTLQVGDFNQDGKQDLVLVFPLSLAGTKANTNPIEFLPGNGDGTFGTDIDSIVTTPPPGNGFVTQPPAGNAVGIDANLDGFPDLVFGSGAIALGDGSGNFTSGPLIFAVPGSSFIGVSSTFSAPLALLQPTSNTLGELVFAPALVTLDAPPTAPLAATYNLTPSAALPALQLSGGAHALTAKYSGDPNFAASLSSHTTVTIAPLTSSISATAAPATSYIAQPVSFAVAVTTSGPTATGSVSLTSGSTMLATSSLDATGKATLTATFSTAGSIPLTIAYAGDANHAASSAQLTQTVVPAVAVQPASGGSASITVASGQTATAPVTLTGAAGFTGAVTLTCSGLPTNASCTFNPSSLTLTGTAPQSSILSLSTRAANTTAALSPFADKRIRTLACSVFAGSLLLLWPRRRRLFYSILLVLLGTTLLPLGCSSGSSSSSNANKTAAGNYTFQVVATAGAAQTTTQYTLTVQ